MPLLVTRTVPVPGIQVAVTHGPSCAGGGGLAQPATVHGGAGSLERKRLGGFHIDCLIGLQLELARSVDRYVAGCIDRDLSWRSLGGDLDLAALLVNHDLGVAIAGDDRDLGVAVVLVEDQLMATAGDEAPLLHDPAVVDRAEVKVRP